MKAPEFRRGPKPPRLRFLEIGFTIALVAGPVCGQAQTEIACGQTISGSLLEAGQTNSYTFSANAGEAVAILTLGQSFNAVAEVFDSAGARLGAATNDFTAPLNLTNTGAYTIGVHADNSTNAGPYGLSLTFLTGRCGAPLIWGLPATNTLTELAQVESFTFTGNTGETVRLEVSSGDTNLASAAFVADPIGTPLVSWVNGVAILNLARTGTYTVGAYSFYPGGMGTYTLSLSFTKLVPASYRLAIGATNGAAALNIWGQVGHPTTLRYKTDLTTTNQWTTLTNFSLPWSPYRFVDWDSTNSPQRFYQTVQ